MNISKKRSAAIIAALVIALSAIHLQGCATMRPRRSLPADQIYNARIPGMPNVRIVLDHLDSGASIIKLEKTGVEEMTHSMPEPAEVTLLAISGGGASGAFGAGLLCGWTQAGTRPQFHIVTGISTGALSGPMAFLGSDYDKTLKDLYTTHSDKDVERSNNPLSVLLGVSDSLMDTKPLSRIIECYVTMDMMKAIAAEHTKGRRFYVGTSQLDAHRMVIWDMGAIASVGTPRALDLFRKVLLASASIPVAFPPVLFEVEVDGKKYDEMHVDGGTTAQTFGSVLLAQHINDHPGSKGKVYVIYNEKLAMDAGSVNRSIMAIASNSVNMMVASQGIGDLFRMYETSKKNGIDFNLAYIPLDFGLQENDIFDPVYMNALFNSSYSAAKAGYVWNKELTFFNVRNR